MSTVTEYPVDKADFAKLQEVQVLALHNWQVHHSTRVDDIVEIAPMGDGLVQRLKARVTHRDPPPDPHHNTHIADITFELCQSAKGSVAA